MWTAEEIRNYQIRDDHDRAIFKAYGMLRDRVAYFEEDARNYMTQAAYENACTILEYAMTDNWACLNQFDYFRKEN